MINNILNMFSQCTNQQIMKNDDNIIKIMKTLVFDKLAIVQKTAKCWSLEDCPWEYYTKY